MAAISLVLGHLECRAAGGVLDDLLFTLTAFTISETQRFFGFEGFKKGNVSGASEMMLLAETRMASPCCSPETYRYLRASSLAVSRYRSS